MAGRGVGLNPGGSRESLKAREPGMTQSELSFRKLHQAGHAGPWEGTEPEARRQEGGLEPDWTPQVPSFPGAARAGRGTQTPSRSDAPPAPDPRTPVLPEVPPPSTLPCLSHPLCTQLQRDTPGRASWGHRGLRGPRGLPGQPRETPEALLSGPRTFLHGCEVLPGPSRGGDLPKQGREDQR